MEAIAKNNFTSFKIVFISTFLLLFGQVGYAQDILAAWDFDGNAGDETTVTAGIIAADASHIAPSGVISRGSGINAAALADRFNANYWVTNNNDNSTISYAVTNNKYMEWSISAPIGYLLNIDSIVFNWRRQFSGPNSVALRSNQDGYAADLDTKTGLLFTTEDLKSILTGFQDIEGTVTFRMYGYGATRRNRSGGFGGAGDDLIVYGSIIPNPANLLTQSFTSCPPSGWSSIRIFGDQDWVCDDLNGYASVTGLGSSAASEMWYVTPSLNFGTLANERMTFLSWTSGTDNTHPKLQVFYSTDYSGVGNPNVATWHELIYNVPEEDSQDWTFSQEVDLSHIPDVNAYIAFKYHSSGTTVGSATEWRIDNVVISEVSCPNPTVQATSLNFTNLASDRMTLNWTKGDGIGRLVIASTNPVTFVPVDGLEYAANSDYSSAPNPGNGDKVVYAGGTSDFELSGLNPSTTYYFAVHEFTCNGSNRTYLGSPLAGSHTTLDAVDSDIIENTSFVYPTDIPYINYRARSRRMDLSNSIATFGMTLRDGGSSANTDGLSTSLTSITFSTNGSTAIRAAAINAGSGLIGALDVNGATEFTIDLSGNPVVASDGGSADFELYVTFLDGDNIVDNQQIVFTMTGAQASASGTPFAAYDAGGAQSSTGAGNNITIVVADRLQILQQPASYIYLDKDFLIEVEATDSRGSKARDTNLEVMLNSGTGAVSSVNGLIQVSSSGTAIWNDLRYNVEESNVRFAIRDVDGVIPQILTDFYSVRPRLCTFSFDGAAGDEPTFPVDVQTGHGVVSDVSRGSSLIATTFAEAFSSENWPTSGFDANGYFEFTVTADDGFSLDITAIEFDHRRNLRGPRDWEMRTSLDGFTSSQGGRTGGFNSWSRDEVVNYTIADEQTVTFRIYAYNASRNTGTWSVDNIEVFGAIRDTRAPSFISGFPQADSARVDGFHLRASADEPVTAYYLVKNYGDQAPTDPNDVINGVSGVQNGSFSVNTSASEVVIGLSIATAYSIYWVLDDGTNAPVINASQLYVRTSDESASATAPASQIASTSIPSTANTAAQAVDVFSFDIDDNGTAVGDLATTDVSKIWIKNPDASTDWTTVIGGLTLNGNSIGSVVIEDARIYADSIVFDIDPVNLKVADQGSETLTLAAYILAAGITDGTSIQFEISQTDPNHVFRSSHYGTQFTDPFVSSQVLSNVHTVEISADSLQFTSVPVLIAGDNDIFSITIQAQDKNGNLDSDVNTTITLSRGIGTGVLASGSSLTKTMTNGIVTWDDLTYDGPDGVGEAFSIVATDNGSVLPQSSSPAIQFERESDLVVSSGNTVTIAGSQSYYDVVIEDNGTLSIAQDAILTIQGDLSIDGAGSTFNDQGGTTHFSSSQAQVIESDYPGKTVDFYNIEISNTNPAGVTSEININLLNTLKLNAGSIFDANGSGSNDYDFTLISTPTNTARIATIENGASLRGNVVWQRSLRTGPGGWRFVGTPIKGQTVGDWRDDVLIQGIQEYLPNSWTNFGWYNEAMGTNGNGGFDGWVDFTQDADVLQNGAGNKLWEWTSQYNPTLTLINKGLPVVGDGSNESVTASEAFNFQLSFTPTAYDGGGWNLLANPYPCELDWDAAEFTHTNIEGNAVHIWNPTLQQYAVYNGSESINGASQYIASGQAFYVKAIDQSAVVSVTENAKSTADGNSFLRKGIANYARLKIKIQSDNNHIDETIVTFRSDADNAYEPVMDARKAAAGWINISTIVEDEHLLAINAMGSLDDIEQVQINLEPYYFGNYTLEFPEILNIEDKYVIRLVDKHLEKSVTINSESKYDFTIIENEPATFGSERFELQLLTLLEFNLTSQTIKAGKEVTIPVYAKEMRDITDMRLELSWDPASLVFIDVDRKDIGNSGQFLLSEIESGILQYVGEHSMDLSDSTLLFELRFTALNGTPNTDLALDVQMSKVTVDDYFDMPLLTNDSKIRILQNRAISGRIVTVDKMPVSGVTLTANGDDVVEGVSGELGDYSISAHELSDYSVSASMDANQSFNAGVSTLDIILARRHVLNVANLNNPYQLVAADVNQSRSISALDLVQMRKIVLGMDAGIQDSWLFIPHGIDPLADAFSYSLESDISIFEDDQSLDFVAIKLGDVNNSWTNSAAGRQSQGHIKFEFQPAFYKNELIEVPVSLKDEGSISGFQFSVQWDPTKLEYAGVKNQQLIGSFNELHTKEGLLAVTWDEPNGQSIRLQNGLTAFNLLFRAKSEEERIASIELNSELTEALAIDNNLNTLSIESHSSDIVFSELVGGGLELLQNSPNPFSQSTVIEFNIPTPGKARLSIINMLGELIYSHEQEYSPGIYQHSWDKSKAIRKISPGVYMYRIESGGEEKVRKMVIR